MPDSWENLIAPLVAGSSATLGQGEVPSFGRPFDPLYPRLGVRFLLIEPDATLPPPLRLAFADRDARIWEVANPSSLVFPAEGSERLAMRRLSPAALRVDVPLALQERAWHLSSGILEEKGWQVRADGRAIPAGRDLGALLAAEIPAGTRRIEIDYRPPGFLLGCLLAALAFGLAAFRGRASEKTVGG
jgi:hypothetical protein